MMEEEQKILNGAMALFLQFGIKSNTMDDVARHIGVSKKTIYKYVSNKEDLLQKVMQLHFEEVSSILNEIQERAENAMDELLQIDASMAEMGKKRNPIFLYELQKFYPETWTMVSSFRRSYVLNNVSRNLEQGIEEGLYRAELHPAIIAKIHLTRLESITDATVFPMDKFNTEEVMRQYFSYHMHGIASDKGLDYLKTKLK